MPANSRYITTPSGIVYDRQTGMATLNGQPLDMGRQRGEGSRRDPRLFGSAGYLGDAHDSWAQNQQAWDSQMEGRNRDYFNTVQTDVGGGDAGPQYINTYELRPEVRERLNGRVQINQLGSGGYHEVRDPSQVEWDDEFGFVTSQDNIGAPDARDTGLTRAMPFIVAAGLGGITAAAMGGGAGAAGGELGLDALESFTATNPGWESAYQAAAQGSGGYAPWEDLGAGDGMTPPEGWSPDGGMPFEQSEIPSLDELGVNPNTGGGTFEGTGWTPESAPTGNPFSARDMIRGANTLRSVLGGGGGGQGQGQGGMPIMGGFGSSPRIGDHKQDNDPFGLKASGWGGGFVKEDPKQKIAQALMERNPWSYTG